MHFGNQNLHFRILNCKVEIRNINVKSYLHMFLEIPYSELGNLQFVCSIIRIQNLYFRIQNLHFRIQNLQFGIQNLQFRIQNSTCKIQNVEIRIINLKSIFCKFLATCNLIFKIICTFSVFQISNYYGQCLWSPFSLLILFWKTVHYLWI